MAFFLPERPVLTQDPVGLVTSESFERPKPVVESHAARSQQMNVVRHDHESVQLVAMESILTVVKRLNDQRCYVRPPKKCWTVSCLIQQAVQRNKRLSGGWLGRKRPALRQAAMEAKGDEEGLANDVPMRKPPLISIHSLG